MMNTFQKKKKSFWLLLSLLLPLSVFAQTLSVNGIVKDELGEGLPGVNIMEEGTSMVQ